MGEHRVRTAQPDNPDQRTDAAAVERQPRAHTDLGWEDESTAVDIVMPMAELIAVASETTP
jgi:hypothetical protein